jgi:hypothetical protein
MNDEFEARRTKARRGWIANPTPAVVEPLPPHHIDKWRRMMGARYLLRGSEAGGDVDGRRNR